jgi:hypothetical protein
MLRFAGPTIATFGLVVVKELSDFSALVSIEANGSLECAADFGAGVIVLCGDASDGGNCESVFACGTFAGLASAAGDEVEVRQ